MRCSERLIRGRDLTGAEKDAVIAEHMDWLGGLMPSARIAADREAGKRELEIERWSRDHDAAVLAARWNHLKKRLADNDYDFTRRPVRKRA